MIKAEILGKSDISLFLKCLNPLTNFIMLKTINSERGTYFLGEVNGNITFESKEGEGTTFNITLPL